MTQTSGKDFFEITRYPTEAISLEKQGLPQPPLELPPAPPQLLSPLPAPTELHIPPMDLQKAIEQRRSLRTYLPDPLTLEELTFLLWCTQGVKKVTPAPGNLPERALRRRPACI